MGDIRSAILSDSRWPGADSKAFLGQVVAGHQVDPVRDLPTPLVTIDLDALETNIASMADWVATRGAELAPHGKTTMAPALWRAQMAAGATGITVATEAQARVAVDEGVPFVIIANEVVAPSQLNWLRGVLMSMVDLEIVCWVDSLEGIAAMRRGLETGGRVPPMAVCIEVGPDGGRAGVRNDDELGALADAVRAAPSLRLVGISGFEGAVPDDGGDRIAAVEGFIDRLGAAFSSVGPFETDRPILTAGGSTYFDLVVDRLSAVAASVSGGRLVLRSGAYVLHDDVHYAKVTPAVSRTGPSLISAATLWAHVLSMPEAGLAVLDAGKRDLAFDLGLPVPRSIRHVDGSQSDPEGARVTATNDQHAFVATAGADFRVGDLVELGQSHPCTIVDKWRELPITTCTPHGGLRLEGFLQTRF